jgi:hypothetical protein
MVVALIWNPRGLNRPDKLIRVHDLIRETCLDIICFSESKKEDFTILHLHHLDPVGEFSWIWLPAKNTSGGILVGTSNDLFDIIKWDIYTYSISALIKSKKDDVVWRIIVVYGSAYEEHKLDFINELHNVY